MTRALGLEVPESEVSTGGLLLEEVQFGLFRIAIPAYSETAFREALANALTHCDYTKRGAIHVQWSEEQLEISSPGGFPEGIRVDNLLVAPPHPRSAVLADAFKRIGLVERTGRVINRMFAEQSRAALLLVQPASRVHPVTCGHRVHSFDLDKGIRRITRWPSHITTHADRHQRDTPLRRTQRLRLVGGLPSRTATAKQGVQRVEGIVLDSLMARDLQPSLVSGCLSRAWSCCWTRSASSSRPCCRYSSSVSRHTVRAWSCWPKAAWGWPRPSRVSATW